MQPPPLPPIPPPLPADQETAWNLPAVKTVVKKPILKPQSKVSLLTSLAIVAILSVGLYFIIDSFLYYKKCDELKDSQKSQEVIQSRMWKEGSVEGIVNYKKMELQEQKNRLGTAAEIKQFEKEAKIEHSQNHKDAINRIDKKYDDPHYDIGYLNKISFAHDSSHSAMLYSGIGWLVLSLGIIVYHKAK